MLHAIEKMESALKKYYQKTQFPTVYDDEMILNLYTKLIIFEEESCEDTSADQYSSACRRCFIQHYNHSGFDSVVKSTTASRPSKCPAYPEDPEFQQLLIDHSTKRRHNNYDRYIKIPNNPAINSSLA